MPVKLIFSPLEIEVQRERIGGGGGGGKLGKNFSKCHISVEPIVSIDTEMTLWMPVKPCLQVQFEIYV